ncbi:hypothetical protein [Natrialba aegyptia]|uniref:Uncharacterized protein n=1 Tax=Natrialba aegyptia DSM 13077 TaxID=1227491 RepID=M0B3E2_9EURY|nr:hypothetical protein [Natrialba aegyptia]ELZ05320.1 hypothetical protein C480_10570 [Natrialba aegyptia DSM 13077]
MRDSITLRWTPPSGRPQRVRLEPRDACGWLRVTEECRDGEWCETCEEIVADVGLEAPAAVIGGGTNSNTGP